MQSVQAATVAKGREIIIMPRRVSRRFLRERRAQYERQHQVRPTDRQAPPLPRPSSYTVAGQADYRPNSHWWGAGIIEVPLRDDVCPYCNESGVRAWDEDIWRSPLWWGFLFVLVASCVGIIVAIILFLVSKAAQHHYYCPSCGAMWS